MTTYDRPSKVLLTEWAKKNLQSGEFYTQSEIGDLYWTEYPEFTRKSVGTDIRAMCVNAENRNRDYKVRPDTGHDLFLKNDEGEIRLWEQGVDPEPIY